MGIEDDTAVMPETDAGRAIAAAGNGGRAAPGLPYVHDRGHESIIIRRARLYRMMLDAVARGDEADALRLSGLMEETIHEVNRRYSPEAENFLQARNRAISANGVLSLKAAEANVHPLLVHAFNQRYDRLIERAFTVADLDAVGEAMIREACAMIREAEPRHYGPFSDRLIGMLLMHITEPVCLPDYAEDMGVTVEHMARRFRAETGMTIIYYVNGRRVDLAKKLMRDPDLSIGQISRRIGFDDPGYFSRVFARYEGERPNAWRRRMMG